jgi:FKBP-type peptidyl-prolyl cis-trans isomerase FkpA
MRYAPLALALSIGLGSSVMAQTLSTDTDKTLYAIGIALGENVKSFALTPAEIAIVNAGISDAAAGKQSKVDMDTYGPKIRELQQERAGVAATAEKQAATAFLAKLAQEPGAQKSASGVIFIPITPGTGANPTAASTVRVHYHGTLRDGTVFDSSVQRNEPISFPLNGVIPCWTEGVQKMKVGGKAKLGCPSDTAYGDAGQGPIPAGAALLFEVELLAIE